MLQKGVIRPWTSSWATKTRLVKKSDNQFRFCVDFRPLNKITLHDAYPLPHLDDLLNQLGKSVWFTSLDLASGYWQIPIQPSDAHKMAFRTPRGLYEFVVMAFRMLLALSRKS